MMQLYSTSRPKVVPTPNHQEKAGTPKQQGSRPNHS
jgi:hypothetical protein